MCSWCQLRVVVCWALAAACCCAEAMAAGDASAASAAAEAVHGDTVTAAEAAAARRQGAGAAVLAGLAGRSPTLGRLLGLVAEETGLSPPAARAWATGELERLQSALGTDSTLVQLQRRWEMDAATAQVDPRVGVGWLRALCKEAAQAMGALERGRDFPVRTLLDRASKSGRLTREGGLEVLRVALSERPPEGEQTAVPGGGAAVADSPGPGCVLALAVISEEVLERVEPWMWTSKQWDSVLDYIYLLTPESMARSFYNQFLTPQFRQEIWDQTAGQLQETLGCGVIRPDAASPGHPPMQLTLAVTIFASGKAPEGWRQFLPWYPREQRGHPAVRTLLGRREPVTANQLWIHASLARPGADRPVFVVLSLANVGVTGFVKRRGHKQIERDYPEGLIYEEPILEDYLVDLVRIQLPGARQHPPSGAGNH